MKDVSVGICGLGTVGGGTFNVLTRNAALIAGRAGCNIRIARVASRRGRDDLDLGGVPFSTDIFDVVNDPSVDVVVELVNTVLLNGATMLVKIISIARSNTVHHGMRIRLLIEFIPTTIQRRRGQMVF